MGTISFGEGPFCSDDSITPTVTGAGGATRFEWEVVEKPIGSQVIISNDQAATPSFTVTEDGPYTFRLCCYFDEGEITTDVIGFDAGLTCPLGVQAGSVATVLLNGCDNGSISNATASAPATGITFDNNGIGSVTTDITGSGTVNVSVDCTIFDDDGNPTTQTFDCSFDVIPIDTILVCETTAPAQMSFITCGQVCRCDEETVVFNCEETICDTAEIGLVFIDCPECPEDEECEQLVPVPLVGGQIPIVQPDQIIDCGCYEERIYDKDAPLLHWNNICSCAGVTLEAPAVTGSSVYNACSCSAGQKWCFEDSATITATIPNGMFIDSMVIWGHDMTNGSVITSLSLGDTTSMGVVTDDACMEGYTIPTVLSFGSGIVNEGDPDQRENVTEFTATITNNNGGLTCIEHIFIGQKLFLPEDALPESFENPHDGSDVELDITTNDCGPVSRTLKRVPVPLTIEFECVDLGWIKEVWRPYIRYAQKHGVLFQHSRNNCPLDIFYGWIPGPVSASRYSYEDGYSVTLNAEGFITQPQPKLFTNV